MKTRYVGVELFRANRRKDMTNPTVGLRNFYWTGTVGQFLCHLFINNISVKQKCINYTY